MNKTSFTAKDLTQIRRHGLTQERVLQQLHTFKEGIQPIQIAAPATLQNGIIQLSEKEQKQYLHTYESSVQKVVKFVPASGAATRMFKQLHQFIATFNPQKDTLSSFLKKPAFKPLQSFFERCEELPFYEQVMAEMQVSHPDYTPENREEEAYLFIQFLVEEMDFSALPKGLIPFHLYLEKTATAFEEHFYEAAAYASHQRHAQLHFTISETHLSAFQQAYAYFRQRIENEENVSFSVTYSFQEKNTDTLAVNAQNEPFRDEKGGLVFRPGGHGALLQNLNKIEADIVFIKNIDNVVTRTNLPLTVTYKKALAGQLITIQKEVFALLRTLDKNGFSTTIQAEAKRIAENFFHLNTLSFVTEKEVRSFYHRPIRICGMVKNHGDPGGGPFWVKNADNTFSLQIVETAQINHDDPTQLAILQKATHFNPVDLVCGIRDYRGQKFDLQQYVNPTSGFITHKSINGKPLKALELPGLWNGSMAHWNTIFVEVPGKTFNPVKTITDLLKPGHQVEIK